MPGYRAGPGGGLFGSNVYGDSRPKVDVGGAIDAITGTALSLTQQAYQRKVAEAAQAREQHLDAQNTQQQQWQRSDADRRFGFEQSKFADEQRRNAAAEEADTASHLADFYAKGFVERPSAPATPPPTSTPYQSITQRAIEQGGSSLGSTFTPPTATPAPAASTEPEINYKGRRLVYKGFGATEAGQAAALKLKEQRPSPMEHVDAGNRVEMRDPVTGNLVETISKGAAPVSPEVQAMRVMTAGQRQDAMTARNEARIVQQFNMATKPHAATAATIQAINENRYGALNHDPIAQQTLLQDFIKLNLPGQIVTAGELHNYAGLRGLPDQVRQILQKYKSGDPLSEAQVKQILGHADNLIAERRKAFNYVRGEYSKRAEREGVDSQALVDPYGFLDEGTPATSGNAPVNPFAGLIPKKP